jgi:hypothetical protein
MGPDELVRIVGAIVAPAVMVTSCSIALGALFTRYAELSSSMRALHRERLDLLDSIAGRTDGDPRSRDLRRIAEIERQLPGLVGRHSQVRDSVLAVVFAVIVLVAAMFLIAAAEISKSRWLAEAALGTFLAALAAFMAGLLVAASELWRSQREVAFEIEDGLKSR